MQARSEELTKANVLPGDEAQHSKAAQTTTPDENASKNEQNGPEMSVESDVDEDPNWITGPPLLIMMSALSIVMFLVLLDSSIIGAATPKITTEFHSLNDVGWYGSAFQLASAACQPLAGKLYAMLNQKWVYLTFFTVFEIGSLLCGVASSSVILIVGRAVAGIGAAGLQSGSLTIVATSAPLYRRASLNGILMALSQSGIVLGPLIGGAFTTYSTWRWCFYINLPLGAVVAGLLFFVRIPQPKAMIPSQESAVKALIKGFDFLGFVLLTGFAVELLIALEWGGSTYAWNSSVIIGLLVGSVATLVVLLFWQHHKRDEAMIQFSIVGKRVVWCSCLNYAFLSSALRLISYYVPIYFQSVLNATAILSGVYTLPSILAQVITSVTSGVLVGKWGYYIPWSILSGILMTVGTGLMSTFSVTTSVGQWIGYQILFGAGCGLGIPMPILAVQNSLAGSDIPIAISILIFFQNIVSAVWLAIASTILTSSLQSYIPRFAPSVDPAAIIQAGATGIRDVVPHGPVLTQVLSAYSKAIDNTFYIATASLGVGIFFVWGMGWKDIRQKKVTTAQSSE